MAVIRKKTLVDTLAYEGNITKIDANRYCDVIFNKIEKELLNGNKIVLKNIGTFKIKHNKEKNYYCNLTDSEITVPANDTVRFQISDNFKEKLNDQQLNRINNLLLIEN